MALVKYGHIIAEARGKLNGTVFSRNTYGAYMREKVTPANPNTTRQQEVRAIFGDAAAAWRSLTDEERTAWSALALTLTRKNVFGDNMPLSGFNFYMRVRVNLATIGATIPTTPPSITPSIETPRITWSEFTTAPAFTVTGEPAEVPVGYTMIVELAAGLSAGISFVEAAYIIIGTIEETKTIETELDSLLATAIPAPVAGEKAFLRVKLINTTTGLPSVPLHASAICTEA